MATTVTIGGGGLLFVGEDKVQPLRLANNGVPVDMTGWTMLFDVRNADNSPDPAIVSKTLSPVGIYNVDPLVNTQEVRVTLSDDDMNLFKARTYRWSWKRMDDGSETVLSRGDFVPEKATAP